MSDLGFTVYIQGVDPAVAPVSIHNVTKDMTLEALKERISQTYGMAVNEQKLSLDGNFIVENFKSLESLGIKESLTLYLVSQPGVFSNLFVRNLAGKTITFNEIPKSMRILDFKKKLVGTSQFDIGAVGAVRLIYAGKQLDDGKCIRDYITHSDATIHTVARLPGGKV